MSINGVIKSRQGTWASRKCVQTNRLHIRGRRGETPTAADPNKLCH